MKSNTRHTYDVCVVSANPAEGLIQRIQCGHNIGRARRIVRIAIAAGHTMTWICCGETWARCQSRIVDQNASKTLRDDKEKASRVEKYASFYAGVAKRFGGQLPLEADDNAETSPFPMVETEA